MEALIPKDAKILLKSNLLKRAEVEKAVITHPVVVGAFTVEYVYRVVRFRVKPKISEREKTNHRYTTIRNASDVSAARKCAQRKR